MISPSRIFHYTSIKSLELILSTRKIRFSRLDHVDDLREAQSHCGIEFGKYFFVSCWTQDKPESIPQWDRYGEDMRGVRIELPLYPFRRIHIQSGQHWSGVKINGDMLAPLSLQECLGPTYFVAPYFFDDFFAGPVDYVPDVGARYAAAVRQTTFDDGQVGVSINESAKLPRLKSVDWEFQSEYRFHLQILPAPSLPEPSDDPQTLSRERAVQMCQAFKSGVDPGINYIDVPLDPVALDDLTVRIGPLCTEDGRARVEAIVSAFAPKARIEPSALTGLVRGRLG